MKTPAEKKRLFWTLIAIFFFFANLTLVTILIVNGMGQRAAPSPPATTPATARSPASVSP